MGISDSLPLFLIRDVVLFNPRIRTSCHSYLPSVFRPSKYEPLLLLTSSSSLWTIQKPRGFQGRFSIFGSGCPLALFTAALPRGTPAEWSVWTLTLGFTRILCGFLKERERNSSLLLCLPCFWKIQKWTFLSAFMLCSWSLLVWWLSSWKQCERNVSVHGQCLWTIQTIAVSKELSFASCMLLPYIVCCKHTGWNHATWKIDTIS